MARWAASAKWAAGPALDGRRDMPLALRLSEGLGSTRRAQMLGMNSVFVRLALEDEVCETEVFIAAPEIEGKRTVIVDPGSEPQD